METTDFQKALARAASEKKLIIGTARTMKLLKKGQVSLAAFASNCPEKFKSAVRASGAVVEVFEFQGTNFALGELCKKPFAVSCLAIIK